MNTSMTLSGSLSLPVPIATNALPVPKVKRRLSDASTDSVASTSKKHKKSSTNGAGKTIPGDAVNKTKSGRFKPGAPVDLNEQCGVINDKDAPCPRSLTCKTHSMGAKRAVVRARPYDTLLAEFQARKEERNKARAQALIDNPELVIKANNGGTSGTGSKSKHSGSGATSKNGTGGGDGAPTKKKKTGDGKASKNRTISRNKADLILGELDDPPEADNIEEEAPDSDDELDQLLIAMLHHKPQPLALPNYPAYIRSPVKLARYRETFESAFTGRTMTSAVS